MDAENIYLQVIYPTLFLGYRSGQRLRQRDYRSYNGWLADVCRQRPDRLSG